MFFIPHLIFLSIYSYLTECYGTSIHWDTVYPDFFLPIFVFILQKAPYPHLVLLVGLIGCFSDIIQGNSWCQLTCLYVLVYLGMDRLRLAQKCSNYFIYAATIIGISFLQPIWLKTTGDYFSSNTPLEQALMNLIFASLAFAVFKLIRLGWAIPDHRAITHPLNG